MTKIPAVFHLQKRREQRRDILSAPTIYNFLKRWQWSCEYLCSAGLQNTLFHSVLDQQMVAEIELKAFNQVGQGHFVCRNPADWICGLMSVKLKGMRWCEISKNLLWHHWDDQLSLVRRDVKDRTPTVLCCDSQISSMSLWHCICWQLWMRSFS